MCVCNNIVKIIRRTPPGVRELKRFLGSLGKGSPDRRTPPGVRELKQMMQANVENVTAVAPLPGCVN